MCSPVLHTPHEGGGRERERVGFLLVPLASVSSVLSQVSCVTQVFSTRVSTLQDEMAAILNEGRKRKMT